MSMGTLCGFSAVFLWSTLIGFSSPIVAALGPMTMLATVYGVSGLFGVFWQVFVRKNYKFSFTLCSFPGIICGSLFTLYLVLLYLSVSLAENNRELLQVTILNYLWPTFTLFLSVFFSGNRVRWGIVPGVIVVTSGTTLVLVSREELVLNSANPFMINISVAHILAISAAFCWALYSCCSNLYFAKKSPVQLRDYFLFTAVMAFLLRVLFGESSVWDFDMFFNAGIMIVVVSGSYLLWEIGIRQGNFVAITIFSYFTPILASLFISLYLDVLLVPVFWSGVFLVVIGAAICKRSIISFKH